MPNESPNIHLRHLLTCKIHSGVGVNRPNCPVGPPLTQHSPKTPFFTPNIRQGMSIGEPTPLHNLHSKQAPETQCHGLKTVEGGPYPTQAPADTVLRVEVRSSPDTDKCGSRVER